MAEFGKWKSYTGFGFATVWMNMSEQDVNMPEYV